jgi:phage tail P2-like protein
VITRAGSILDVALDQTLPPVLGYDEKMAAFGRAMAKVLQKQAKSIYDTDGIYYQVENLPERVLDILASDLHADWYDYDGSLANKRRLIQNDVEIHRRMGTPVALRRVLEGIHGDSTVEEWFQYGGEPYFFRVAVTITDTEEVIQHDRIMTAIRTYKPVRAHLEEENIAYRCRRQMITSVKAGYCVYYAPLAGLTPINATIGEKRQGSVTVQGKTGAASYAVTLYDTPLCGEGL